MPTSRTEVGVQITLKDKLSRPLKSMSASFKKFGRDLSASKKKFAALNAQMKLAGKKSIAVGKTMTRRMTLPLLAVGAAAIKTGMDFNKGMANIATLMPGNTKKLKALSDGILKLSTETGTSTKDLSEGMYNVVSAFGDAGDSMAQLRIVNKAAIAGVSTTSDALDLLSAVTKGYGDTSLAAMKQVSDLAFMTVKLGKTTFPELAASMGMVVPTANALKISQQELFATFATLTGVTGNASVVATQLRSAMSGLASGSKYMEAAVKKAGGTSAEAMVKEKGLVATLRTLVATTDGSQGALKKMFGRVEAVNAVLALTGSQAKTFDEKFKKMKDTVGATDKAFGAQTKGVNKAGFAWKRMLATVKVLSIRIGQLLLPVFSKIVSALSGLFKFITDLPGPIKVLVIALAGLAAVAGPILMLAGSFLKLRKAFKMVKLSFSIMSKSMSMNPVFLKLGLLVAGIVAIVSIFKKSTVSIEENKSASKKLSSEMDQLAKAYGKAGANAKKLTQEQRDQLKLRLLEASQKAEKAMASNYEKQVQVMGELRGTDKGTKEHEMARLKLRQLQSLQRVNMSTVERGNVAMGMSKKDAAVAAKGTASSAFGQLSSYEQKSLMAGNERQQQEAKNQALADTIGKKMTEWVTNSKLQGQINIHVKSDGTATAAVGFKGGKISTSVSAQSVKNGRTRK